MMCSRIDRISEMVTLLSAPPLLLRRNFSMRITIIIYLPWPKPIDQAWFDNDCLDIPTYSSGNLLFFCSCTRNLSDSVENGSRIEHPGGIAIQFLFASFCGTYIFLALETKARKFNTWLKVEIKSRVKISRSSYHYRDINTFCMEKQAFWKNVEWKGKWLLLVLKFQCFNFFFRIFFRMSGLTREL